ncbi:sulfite exporter TauE/SafE family protein [Caproicibacter sp.]|uniref:sulfite exporter TauE/SafE family protein n=1 Tax=Caproicibacter sp. TaxID=2814884 RepID=UPI0039891395
MKFCVLILASLIASFISGTAGFGGALLLLPAVTAYVGVQTAVPVLTIAQLIGNLSRMIFGFRQIDWPPVGLFCITALPGAALGAFGFSVLPSGFVTRAIGGVLIAFVFFKLLLKIDLKPGNKTILAGGAAVGLLSGLAGSGGPIGAAVFLTLGLPPVAYIASEAATATAMHILKTVLYSKLLGIDRDSLIIGLLMGVAMIIGSFCSNKMIRKMEKAKYQKYVAVFLGIIGVTMLITGT